eukprot:gene3419-3884_t
MAYDSRGHGQTKTSDDNDIDAAPPTPLKIVLVGHSMGGAVVVKASSSGLILNQAALVVVDVVEGTAMSALPSMRLILSKKPSSFASISEAIKWSGTLRNIESARISIPSQLRLKGDRYVWITDLEQTEKYWKEWFTGLSKEFLASRAVKLLVLAGSDRLDKELTIAQMQGKFQLVLLTTCGHVIQEDVNGRVPEAFSISSPSPKKRPYGSSMIASPPTPTMISNSPFFHGTSSHNHHPDAAMVPQQISPTMFHESLSALSPALIGGIESPPSIDIMEEDLEDQIRDILSPVIFGLMDHMSRENLYSVISDYINEEISFRNLLLDLRLIPIFDNNYKSIFQYLIDMFLAIDTTQKMVNFLKDNGVEENEISIDLKALELSSTDTDGVHKKKRERVRKSVSRGLRNPPNKWTKEESQRLIQLVGEHGDKQWKKIAHQIGGGKTGAQCAQHWKRVLCPLIRKGSWDEDEESKLFLLVEKHGQSWKNVASEIRTRTDIQCRYQYFKSCMSREVQWSTREDEILQKKVAENKIEGRELNWMDVSKGMARGRQTKIPRTALECKIRWTQINFGGPPIQTIPVEELHQQLQQSPSLNSLLRESQQHQQQQQQLQLIY